MGWKGWAAWTVTVTWFAALSSCACGCPEEEYDESWEITPPLDESEAREERGAVEGDEGQDEQGGRGQGRERQRKDAPKPPPAEPGGIDEQTLSPRGNQTIGSFRESKRIIVNDIFQGRQETFYCGCRYTLTKKVYLGPCGYKVRRNKPRAQRLEVEHVVPAENFGSPLPSWAKGHPRCLSSKKKPYKGRRCASKISKLFEHMEADLYNLQPAIGEVNGDRSNYDMAIIPGEAREYGQCDVEIDGAKVEPRPAIRGDIARTYFYMDWAYPGLGILNDDNRALFEAWDKADPVSDEERERAARIKKRQGNDNPFIK